VAEETLRLLVRTPRSTVFDEAVTSLRVPGDTGQVGFRPRSEPAALAVEPGVALAAARGGMRFIATAGGLLRCDRHEAVLLTPLAVVGEDAQAVAAAMQEALEAPSADRELRTVLQRLETGILEELRRATGPGAGGGQRG